MKSLTLAEEKNRKYSVYDKNQNVIKKQLISVRCTKCKDKFTYNLGKICSKCLPKR